ncbi:MAG: alpha/beta hydrolase [Roseiarcus sp.]|jgi:pimeloyl-ACP methyl ester carboxylesterase
MIERSIHCLGPSGFHRLVYSEWPGPKGAPTLLCVHGLTRNGKDFDTIAEALSAHYRVVCPDMPGRGRSDYLAVPADYGFPVYLADLASLIARLDVESVDWLGTSMGGLVGMMMAAQPGHPIRRLVLNDAGPFIPKTAVERLRSYVGLDPVFPSLEAMEGAMRQVYAVLGPMTDAQMRRMTEVSARRKPDGSYGFAYDPHIGDALKAAPPEDVNLWPVWDAIKCPVLLLRGAVSDVVPREVAEEMTRRGPKAKLVEFAGIGHAPPLLTEDQISAVRDFLLA